MPRVASEDGRIAALSRELEDLRGRYEAVAEILRALSRSGVWLQPGLDRVVEAGRGASCLSWLADGELLRLRAGVGLPPDTEEYERLNPERPGLGTCTGRVA